MQEHSLIPKSSFENEISVNKPDKKSAKSFGNQSARSIDLGKGAKNSNREEIAVLLTNAEVLISHGERSLATNLVRKALALNSHHVDALKKLARCLGENGDLGVRQKIYEALNKSDYGFENLAHLAHVYYLQNKDGEAFEKYQEALSVVTEESKGLFEVYKNIGNILVRAGDFDGAEEFYNKAFELDAQNDILLVNLGTLAIQRSNLDQALERFRKALDVNSKNGKAWVGLAMVHNAMGDIQLAKANLINAIEAEPRNRTAVHLFSNWCVRDLTYSAGIEVLQNYLSKVECDQDMSLILIHLFCLTNCNDLALVEAERVLLWDPENMEIQKIERSLRQSQ